jgi:hypothetical protein
MFYGHFNLIRRLMVVIFYVGVNPEKWANTFLVY